MQCIRQEYDEQDDWLEWRTFQRSRLEEEMQTGQDRRLAENRQSRQRMPSEQEKRRVQNRRAAERMPSEQYRRTERRHAAQRMSLEQESYAGRNRRVAQNRGEVHRRPAVQDIRAAERRQTEKEVREVQNRRAKQRMPAGTERQTTQRRRMEQDMHTEENRRASQRRRQEIKRKQKIRRRILRLAWQGVFICAAILLIAGLGKQLRKLDTTMGQAGMAANIAENYQVEQKQKLGSGETAEMDYVDFCGLDKVDKPVKREPGEVLAKLEELGAKNALIEKITQNTQLYPDNMLEALANNPEMADFVSGYPEAEKGAAGGLTEQEKKQEYPLFLQWDPRWGYASYGDDSNIGLAGCGPVSLSMALYYLTKDDTLTPDKIASYSMEHGYYMSGTGTAWALMKEVPPLYGVKVNQPGINEQIMKAELDKGNVIICAMRPGDFTAAGHFIVIYGYDKKGFKVNDPNCVARSRRSWSYEQIGNQIKNLWSFSV